MKTVAVLQPESLSYIMTGIDSAAHYRFRITACDPVTGFCSWQTPTVWDEAPSQLHPELVPDLHAARVSGATAYVEWEPAAYAGSYRLQMRPKGGKFRGVFRADPTEVHEWVADLSPEGEYSFRVQACRDAACVDYSPEAGIGTEARAFFPTELAATRLTGAVAQLSWKQRKGVHHYEIEVASGEGEYQETRSTGRRGAYTVGGLNPDFRYRFRIRACLLVSGPCSGYSPPVVAETKP